MGLAKRFFERAYRRGRTPWDTGITPPEVVEEVSAMEPGRALDLGCGTGTNVLWLVQRGWTAVGVDFSALAIESARRKADWTSGAEFVEGDVTRLRELAVEGSFDLVLDIGCFHSVPTRRRDDYVREVTAVARPGARMMIYAFGGWFRWPGSTRTREREIRRRFGGAFQLDRVVRGRHPEGSAWFYLARR
ncbi:MAG TPA: methyltransferase domain-containing protein [Actinomycetota bacterium]|nr:methyltransferase domain-containing protein [Actinomycetota bacterium]